MLDSSVWSEPYEVRLTWTALLALKESDHVVRMTAYQIAKRANMKESEVLDALEILSEPDNRRIEPQPFEGRRIQKVEGGWLILNGQKYEDLMRLVSRRAYKARKERDYRVKRKGGPQAGERQSDREYGDHPNATFRENPPEYNPIPITTTPKV